MTFQAGNKVEDFINYRGEIGEVLSLDYENKTYPLFVEFPSGYEIYTLDGRYHANNKEITLKKVNEESITNE